MLEEKTIDGEQRTCIACGYVDGNSWASPALLEELLIDTRPERQRRRQPSKLGMKL